MDTGAAAWAPTNGNYIEGVVLDWSNRGFGFINLVDGRRVYVHASAIGGGDLERGERVLCSVSEDTQNPGKWAAVEVLRPYQETLRQQRQQQSNQMVMGCGGMGMMPMNNMMGCMSNQMAMMMQQQQMMMMKQMGTTGSMMGTGTGGDQQGPVLEGVVVEWSERGFGFVTFADGRRAYVHHSSVQSPTGKKANVELTVGETVEARVVEDTQKPGKWAAVDVLRKAEAILARAKGLSMGGHAVGSSMPGGCGPCVGCGSCGGCGGGGGGGSRGCGACGGCGGCGGCWGAGCGGGDDSDRQQGVVNEWHERGYGFATFGSQRVYVHVSNCLDFDRELKQGEVITAKIQEDEKHPGKMCAVQVRRASNSMNFGGGWGPGMGSGGWHGGGDSAFGDGHHWHEGKVEEWNGRGFGFIALKKNSQRAYIHVSVIGGGNQLTPGEVVSVKLAEDDKNSGKLKVTQLKMGPPTQERGEVTEWNQEAGYGFLTMDDGRKVYIHASVFKLSGLRDLTPGTQLTVVTKPDDRNPGKWAVAEVKSGIEGFGEDAKPATISAVVSEWDARGYGFAITDPKDGERRVYVHHTAFGTGDLEVGERVSMTVGPDLRNPHKYCALTLVRDEGVAGDVDAARRPPAGVPGSVSGVAPADTMASGEFSRPLSWQGSGTALEDWKPGFVLEWTEEKGYGFVELSDGRRLYVHHSSFGGGSLLVGVECEAIASPDRMNPGKWMASQLRGLAVVPKEDGAPPTKRQRVTAAN